MKVSNITTWQDLAALYPDNFCDHFTDLVLYFNITSPKEIGACYSNISYTSKIENGTPLREFLETDAEDASFYELDGCPMLINRKLAKEVIRMHQSVSQLPNVFPVVVQIDGHDPITFPYAMLDTSNITLPLSD